MSRNVINLADISAKASKRGRKSTVTPEDIETAQSLDVGEAIELDEFDLEGDEFAKYYDERIGRYHGDRDALMNAWTSRHRQRVASLAKLSGVDLIMVTTEDGKAYAGRQS